MIPFKRPRAWILCVFLWPFCFAAAQDVMPPSKVNLTFQVYDGDKFVLDLAMDDFVVFEEGKEMTIDLKNYTQEQLINATNTVLKRALSSSGTYYLAIIEEMTKLVREMKSSGDFKNLLIQYRQQLASLEVYRKFDEPLYNKIAEEFGKGEGPHHFFLFYGQEFVPVPESDVIEEIRRNPYLMFDAAELFESEKKDIPAGADSILSAFTNAGLHFHLVYLKKLPRPQRGIVLREHSGDMFNIFQKLAQATGGIVETTSLPVSTFQRAAESAGAYYRLTYASPDRRKDGTFRGLTISVKDKDYRVLARKGYFDN